MIKTSYGLNQYKKATIYQSCFVFALILMGLLFCYSLNIQAQSLDEQVEEFQFPKKETGKVAYLTFDDGPSLYTEALLDILEEEQVPAIFFVIGENFTVIPSGKELVKEMHDKGHYVGLHSMTHDKNKLYLSANAPQNFINEMLAVKELVAEATNGFQSELCRPPYGSKAYFTRGHYEAVKESKLNCWDWNIDSMDWAAHSSQAILNKVKNDLAKTKYPDVTVLLFHEKKITVNVIAEVIQYYREAGYEFVSYHPEDNVEFTVKQVFRY